MNFKIAVASLNQMALDFAGNTRRIIDSIADASSSGAIYRLGPELEVCGYSLEDAFFEEDSLQHCWQSLRDILDITKKNSMIIDVGMPVRRDGLLYNCRIICRMGRILCIRAKTSLANDGNYREQRHFSAWPLSKGLTPFKLPPWVGMDQPTFVPFGADFVLDLLPEAESEIKLRLGWEICQELWDTNNVCSGLYDKYGCHLVINSSGSYWELRKLDIVGTMIKDISRRKGACYAYSNLFGFDGQRYVFSGRSCVYDRGNLERMLPVDSNLLTLERHLILYDVSPRDIDEHRAQQNLLLRDATARELKSWDLYCENNDASMIDGSYKVLSLKLHELKNSQKEPSDIVAPAVKFQDEINIYVSLWLWDYLRRSKMKGFMVPLSGGLDSCSVAMLVFGMCIHLHNMLSKRNNSAVTYFIECHGLSAEELTKVPPTPQQICRLLLKCAYLSTKYSSQETESRARKLCQSIGAQFSVTSIQGVYDMYRQLNPEGRLSDEVTLLDQNLQARLRMAMTYDLSEGNRLVLATGNVDEAIMGYLTKYDCSSGDINPIGGLCKEDLKSYLKHWCETHQESKDLVDILKEIIDAPPSAELTGSEQRDEDEIGITYEEISVLGKVRRGIYGCYGPAGAFERIWRDRHNAPFSTKLRCLREGCAASNPGETATQLGDLIKRFYQRYMRNRHKLTVLTPALHAETYSPDDNRFDHRQILYPRMTLQFNCIDQMVALITKDGNLPGDVSYLSSSQNK